MAFPTRPDHCWLINRNVVLGGETCSTDPVSQPVRIELTPGIGRGDLSRVHLGMVGTDFICTATMHTPFSISIIVKFDSAAIGATGGFGAGDGIVFYQNSQGGIDFELLLDGNQNICFRVTDTGGTGTVCSSTTAIAERGYLVHAVYNWDGVTPPSPNIGDRLILCINGFVDIGSTPANDPATDSVSPAVTSTVTADSSHGSDMIVSCILYANGTE